MQRCTGGRDVTKMYFGLCAGGGARHSGIAFSSRVLHLLTIIALAKTLLNGMLNASRFVIASHSSVFIGS